MADGSARIKAIQNTQLLPIIYTFFLIYQPKPQKNIEKKHTKLLRRVVVVEET